MTLQELYDLIKVFDTVPDNCDPLHLTTTSIYRDMDYLTIDNDMGDESAWSVFTLKEKDGNFEVTNSYGRNEWLFPDEWYVEGTILTAEAIVEGLRTHQLTPSPEQLEADKE